MVRIPRVEIVRVGITEVRNNPPPNNPPLRIQFLAAGHANSENLTWILKRHVFHYTKSKNRKMMIAFKNHYVLQ